MNPGTPAPRSERPRASRIARRALLALAVLLALGSPACGRKRAAKAHAGEETPAAVVPTPDNTPINVLRTPAGLVLKTDEPTPRETTPAPSPASAPAAASAPAPQATP